MRRTQTVILCLLSLFGLQASACAYHPDTLTPADGVAHLELWELPVPGTLLGATHPYWAFTPGDGNWQTSEVRSSLDPNDNDHLHEYDVPAARALDRILRIDEYANRQEAWHGQRAIDAWRAIQRFNLTYPYKGAGLYRALPGPNSNTYGQRSGEAAGLGDDLLSWRAWGAGWKED